MSRAVPPPARLDAEARREKLLDVAQALFLESGPAEVTMGTVAERAEVTRALVYKHFANRDDILAALYRREARALDRALRKQVEAAPDGFEPKLRAFVRSVLEAVGTHSGVFVPLRPFGQDAAYRREQRAWDRRTVRYFAQLAAADFGLDDEVAQTAVAIVLSGISSVVEQASTRRGHERDRLLEDLFVEMAVAGLKQAAART